MEKACHSANVQWQRLLLPATNSPMEKPFTVPMLGRPMARAVASVGGGFPVPEASSEVLAAGDEGRAGRGVRQGSDWAVVA